MSSVPLSDHSASNSPGTKPARVYVPAVGPRLRILLFVVFALVAVLAANSTYLAGVTAAEWYSKQSLQDQFYQLMFLSHLGLGLLLILPLVAFGLIHMVTSRKRKDKRAIRIGYALFAIAIVVLLSGIALMQAARTLAAFSGRDYAVPDDVVQIALPALRHRVILTAEAEVEGRRVDELLTEMIRTVEVPRL